MNAPSEDLDPALPRRLRALRILAGYDRQDAFAAALDVRGLAFDTLASIERGERGMSQDERAEVCDFAGVGRGWFELTLDQIAPYSPPPTGNELLELMDRKLEGLVSGQRAIGQALEGLLPTGGDLLSAIDSARRAGGARKPPAHPES